MFFFELFYFGDLSHSLTIPSTVKDFKISTFSLDFSPESPIPNCFIHSYKMYLLITHYVPGTVLGTEDPGVSQTDTFIALIECTF